jgi:hypothetical protein
MASPVVGLPVANELLEAFDKVKDLLPGEEVGREEDPLADATIIQMRIPDAPANATRMNVWFTRHDNGDITVDRIDYHAADGSPIT